MSTQSSVLSLIKQKRWSDVIARCQFASTHEICELDPSNFNANPLHLTITLHAPYNVISCLIHREVQINKMKETRNGYIPLYSAIRQRSSLEVISLLIKTYKDAVSMRDKHGWSCIHIACYFNSCPLLVNLLLSIDPSLAKMKTRQNALPLHIACQRKATLPVVQSLLENYPEGAKEAKGGWLSLHLAIWHEAPEEVIIELVKANPEATRAFTSSSAQTPLSLYWSNCVLSKRIVSLLIDPSKLMRRNEKDIGIIHKVLHFPQNIPNLLTYVLEEFDDDASSRDDEGRLPLHAALELRDQVGMNAWKKIFRQNPKAIVQSNCQTYLYPFMMASMISDLDLSYEIIRLAPNIFEELCTADK